MKKWTYLYGKNTIEVVYYNGIKHELYVNGQLQDKKTAFLTNFVTLQGKLKSGEEIKASFGESITTAVCTLLVDDRLLKQNTAYPVEQKTAPISTNQTPVREVTIIREIVKIPCYYCNQLVDITVDKCPNCGAKNTRYTR
jgi:hypothetical protein